MHVCGWCCSLRTSATPPCRVSVESFKLFAILHGNYDYQLLFLLVLNLFVALPDKAEEEKIRVLMKILAQVPSKV